MSDAPPASDRAAAAGVSSESLAPRDVSSGGRERVLVIRLGALGDFVLSLGPMAAIRRHHAGAHIVLLTTAPFAGFAQDAPYWDEIWIDPRASFWKFWRTAGLMRRLRAGRFDRVYDLQTSRRTARYWRAMGRPPWSGHVPGAAYAHVDPARDAMHTVERQRAQLAIAGIDDVLAADLSWVRTGAARFGLSPPYVMLVPGGSAHRPKKRWPVEKYTALARNLVSLGVTPVLIGSAAERPVLAEIARHVPEGVDLCGHTSLEDIVGIARGALGAIGNDTGPMHLAAAAGAPSVVLFSAESDPALCAPRPGIEGGKVVVLRRPDLHALSVAEVLAALPFTLPIKR